MKQKKNETIPVGLLVGLLFLCTAAAGGIALLAKGDLLKMPEISFDKIISEERVVEPSELPQQATADEEETSTYVDEELNKTANTYGEIFGLLVTEGKSSLCEDKYCADELYRVEYESGEVQLKKNSGELYWFARSNVKHNEIKLTERQLVSKAKEYLAILQLGEEYGNIARKVDRENNIATVIFQRVVDEELELYSDYEAVKMLLSAQTGELMSCKIFDLPLVEQEGQMIGQNEAIASVQDQLSLTFEQKAKAELSICSPIAWGDDANFTSRIVWNVTADGVLYYVDAYSGDVLGSRTLEV